MIIGMKNELSFLMSDVNTIPTTMTNIPKMTEINEINVMICTFLNSLKQLMKNDGRRKMAEHPISVPNASRGTTHYTTPTHV